MSRPRRLCQLERRTLIEILGSVPGWLAQEPEERRRAEWRRVEALVREQLRRKVGKAG